MSNSLYTIVMLSTPYFGVLRAIYELWLHAGRYGSMQGFHKGSHVLMAVVKEAGVLSHNGSAISAGFRYGFYKFCMDIIFEKN
jgi:hypothetical protein